MSKGPDYQWSDAWLLQAIICAGGRENGASLFDIIRTGDGLNHAIFSNDELESGFARLTSGGLITAKGELFFATNEAVELYEQASKRSGSPLTIRERLAKKLKAEPWNPRQQMSKSVNNLKYPGFSPENVEETIDRYHKEAKQVMEKLFKNK